MKYQKQPCNECPFRRNSAKGWLGGFTVEETLCAARSEDAFDCHLTRGTEEVKSCAGRLLFAVKTCKSFRNKELESARLELKEQNKDLSNILGFDFAEHHNIKKDIDNSLQKE